MKSLENCLCRKRFWMGVLLLAAALAGISTHADDALAAPPAPASKTAVPPKPVDHPASNNAAPIPTPAPRLRFAPLAPPKSPYVSDAQIGAAIDKGAAFLKAQFKNSTLVEGSGMEAAQAAFMEERKAGSDALAVYALLQCGRASGTDPDLSEKSAFMKGLIDIMKTLQSKRYFTYSRGIRATCLALINRPEDHGTLISDVEDLLDACLEGSYSYGCPPDRIGSFRKHAYAGAVPMHGDNSNSQYGLLGIWSAAEIGAEIPDDYWRVVERHWTGCQYANGTWPYYSTPNVAAPGGSYTMTMAGLASSFVCHDYVDQAKFTSGEVGREPFTPAIEKGLAWMNTGNNAISGDANPYGDYGLERVGLASGFKYFGEWDWYRAAATRVVALQQADGSWAAKNSFGDCVATSYVLLFLARGRHPILMNKLQFDHFWSNRPRDVDRLANYASHELEHPFNWQVVNLQHNWDDWLDSPILYIASHVAPKLTDADYAKIRAYVNAGGTLFTQADGNTPAFNEYMEKTFVPKVFPEYGEMTKIPTDHPLYSAFMQMKVKPSLMCVTNGARLLMVYSPQDLSMWWQQRASKSHKDAFDFGLNLFVYAAGKRDFQNRIATNFIPSPWQPITFPAVGASAKPTVVPAATPSSTLKIARVKYPLPTWDPEPYAWDRLANSIGWNTSIKLETQTIDMDKLADLSPAQVPLAHLTGTLPYAPTPAQLAGLTSYVTNGGILFIDACGGGGFNDSIKKILQGAFPDLALKRISSSSPLLTASAEGMNDCSKPTVRSYAKSIGMRADGFTSAKFGKGQVIYSTQDITNGLLGSQTWGINGYEGPYCLKFMQNLVFWAARGTPDAPAATAPSAIEQPQ